MKYINKIFLFISLFFIAISCGKEEDSPAEKPEGGDSQTQGITLSLSTTGIQGVTIKDMGTDLVQQLQVKCNENQAPDKDVPFTLSAWTEAELDAYNTQKGTEYFLLPANTYSISHSGTIAQGKTASDIAITFKPNELMTLINNGNAGKQYVLPLRLSSNDATVQEIRSEVIFTVSLYIPTVELLQKDYGTAFLEEEEDTRTTIGTRLMMGTSTAECNNPFTYELKVAENAAELVDEYNRTHGTGYELLPETAYTMENGKYNAGDRTSECSITIHKSKTGDGSYLLPFCLGGENGKVALNNPSVSYLTTGKHFYSNPIIRYSAPDPSVIRAQDGYFYLYGTEDTYNMPIYQSKDMVNWEYKNTAFTNETRPTWEGNHSLWAPEIRYINGKYVLYYSWAKWGDHWNSEVGVATADNPLGPFIDHGQVIDAQKLNVENSIDQFEFEDGGKKYLFWGSFRGIYVVELTDDGLSVKCNSDGTPVFKQQVAGNAYEGTCIYKRGEWYYLFASIGACCEEANSTYQTVVGRSKSLFGPYVNRSGGKMLNNQHEILISGDGNFVGTGHNSIIQHDDAGQAWMILHGYVKAEADRGRYVMLEQLLWDEEGWPSVKETGVLSAKALAPVIK